MQYERIRQRCIAGDVTLQPERLFQPVAIGNPIRRQANLLSLVCTGNTLREHHASHARLTDQLGNAWGPATADEQTPLLLRQPEKGTAFGHTNMGCSGKLTPAANPCAP